MPKLVLQTWCRQATTAAVATLLVLGLCATSAFAVEPQAEIAFDAKANNFTVATYDVWAEEEIEFLETLTTTGGFVGDQPGFAVEKVVRSIEGAVNGIVRIWVLTRHYNGQTMLIAQEQRMDKVRGFLANDARVIHTEVGHNQVSNWGHERGESVEFTRTPTLTQPAVFDAYGTSLAFFKYGYTGQLGWIQEHSGQGLQSAEAEVLSFDSVSGATVAQAAGNGPVVSYAEFFSTPAEVVSRARNAGGISGVGTVILNYRER